MSAAASATLTIKAAVVGTGEIRELGKVLSGLSAASARASATQAAASIKAASTGTRAQEKAAKDAARLAERLAREQVKWNEWVEKQKYISLGREMKAADRAAAQQAQNIARNAQTTAKAVTPTVAALRTVEGEIARLQRLSENRAITASARAQLGLDPSILTGHGFVNRTRQGIGLMRDLAVAGIGVRYAFGAAAAGVHAAIAPVMEYESLLADVKNKGGFSAKQMALITGTTTHMGRTSQFSATQSAKAAVELAAAGVSAEGIGTALPSTLRFAQASGLSTEAASATMVESMAQFGLAASDFERIGDAMVKGANMSTISVADMAESLKYVGPLAKAAGMDLEQTSATIALLGERGLKGSMGGTALRKVIDSLTHPAKQARKAMGELGLSKEDMHKGLSDLPTFFARLREKMSGEDSAKRLELSKMLFGTEGEVAAQILMNATEAGKDGKTAWQGFTEGVRGGTGAMKAAADVAGNTLAGKMARLHAAVESAQIAVGGALAPALTKVIPRLANAAVATGDWISRNSELVSSLAIAVPSIVATGSAISGVSKAVEGIGKFSSSLGVSMGMPAGEAFGTSFIGAALPVISAGIAGFAIGSVIAKALDMEGVGAKIYEWLHGGGKDRGPSEKTVSQAIAEEKAKQAPMEEKVTDPILRNMQQAGAGVPAALAQRAPWAGKLEIEITHEGKPRVVNLRTDGPELILGTNMSQ